MLTPQEVAEHGFSKSRMGGYNMKEVDDFLDELTSVSCTKKTLC